MWSIDDFNEILKNDAENMHQNEQLKKNARELLIKADHHRWIHQTKWMGVPVLQTPEDLLQIQEIIWKTQPEVIIECGVAFGGGTLFLANMLNNLPDWRMVVGIDLYIPKHLIDMIDEDQKRSNPDNHITKFSWVELIEGDSTSEETVSKVQHIVEQNWNKRCMLICDSNHSHDHVLKELNIYSKFLKSGDYIVVSDTWADELSPEITARQRPWGPGNSPRTALKEFLKNNPDFEIDEDIQKKLLMSTNPDGYVRKK